MTICIYHGNCADGFGAAWVVRKALGDAVEFYPGIYGEKVPDTEGKDVLLVDFSYKRPIIEQMLERARKVTIIDHHKTAVDDLDSLMAPNFEKHFDITHSGAMLSWMHFFPGEEAPALIRHIEDRDLWKFQLEGTREIQAALFSFSYDFEVWDKLMTMDAQLLRKDGEAIERKHFKDIRELLTVCKRRMVIGGHNVPVASLPYTLSSDAGNIMAEGEPFSACYYDGPDGRNFSLRSRPEGMDVSEIAKQYGGGGHKNAAGFKVTFHEAFEFEINLAIAA